MPMVLANSRQRARAGGQIRCRARTLKGCLGFRPVSLLMRRRIPPRGDEPNLGVAESSARDPALPELSPFSNPCLICQRRLVNHLLTTIRLATRCPETAISGRVNRLEG